MSSNIWYNVSNNFTLFTKEPFWRIYNLFECHLLFIYFSLSSHVDGWLCWTISGFPRVLGVCLGKCRNVPRSSGDSLIPLLPRVSCQVWYHNQIYTWFSRFPCHRQTSTSAPPREANWKFTFITIFD